MYRTKLLVVANQTVDSDELYAALHERAERGPLTVTLLVPQDQPAGSAHRVNAALERLHAAGIQAEAMLGDVDPACAVIEVWDPRRWDEVLVSTLPSSSSRWLRTGLPQRINRAVDVPVQHVISQPAHSRVASYETNWTRRVLRREASTRPSAVGRAPRSATTTQAVWLRVTAV
jgi:hypothetical protein